MVLLLIEAGVDIKTKMVLDPKGNVKSEGYHSDNYKEIFRILSV